MVDVVCCVFGGMLRTAEPTEETVDLDVCLNEADDAVQTVGT